MNCDQDSLDEGNTDSQIVENVEDSTKERVLCERNSDGTDLELDSADDNVGQKLAMPRLC